MLTKMSLLLIIMTIPLKHPMSMGMMLLLLTFLTSLNMGILLNQFWFSYILFLIMIGGMLILFIYMTSIASNEKFKFNLKLMIIMTIFASFMMFVPEFSMNKTFDYYMMDNLMNLIKFMNFPNNKMLYFIFIYLFITLIAIVKISNIKKGPLRQLT
uniref:NADH-ubiquinone oxidoreductase chain 6 n=1 Tax=Leiodidae sp. BMNH 1274324 TaxID=1796521 RepID=A0A126TFC3_9COLE|nr:NADH dehydrogenase subunit 6 [Leiodidae sp. BMNH 1274324]